MFNFLNEINLVYWMYWIIVIVCSFTAIISLGWYWYKKGDVSRIYLFITVKEIGIVLLIGIALYARYLKIYVCDDYFLFLDGLLWHLRPLLFLIGISLYTGQLCVQFYKSFKRNKREEPKRRVGDE